MGSSGINANPFKSSPAPAPFRISADPTAAAASNFLNAVGGTDICAKASKSYVEAVSAGKSAVQATNAAKQAYISAYNSGTRNAQGTPCAAAEVNFKSNFGSNNVLTAMEAFINSGESGVDPVCIAAAEAYIDAKIANNSDEDALSSAATAYIAAINANPGAG